MKSLSASLVSVALLVAAVSAQFQINTPNPPSQCVPVQITWTGGTPPYFLEIKPGGQPQAPALQQYPNLQGPPFTWQTNISSGQSVFFQVTDNTGSVAQSAPVTIQSSPETSCLNGQSSGSSAAAGSSTSAAAGASTTATTPAASSTGAATSGGSTAATSAAGGSSAASRSGTPTGSSASSSASATGGSGSNGALSNVASMGVVGVLGAVAAALLA